MHESGIVVSSIVGLCIVICSSATHRASLSLDAWKLPDRQRAIDLHKEIHLRSKCAKEAI